MAFIKTIYNSGLKNKPHSKFLPSHKKESNKHITKLNNTDLIPNMKLLHNDQIIKLYRKRSNSLREKEERKKKIIKS